MDKQITQQHATSLIQLEAGEAWITSLVISKEFGRAHKSVLSSVDDLIADGTIDRHDFAPISYTDEMNRPQRALREGMAQKMYYKDIYQLAKQRVESLAAMVGKSLPGNRTRRIAA